MGNSKVTISRFLAESWVRAAKSSSHNIVETARIPSFLTTIPPQEDVLKIWYVYSVLTVVTWGLWGVFSKLASNYSKPKQALLFQTVGVLAFAVVVLFMEKFHFEWSVPGFSWAALGGFFAFVGFLTFFAALDQGKASTVVTLSALYPLVTILLSITFLHERLTARQGIGIVFALIASALLAA